MMIPLSDIPIRPMREEDLDRVLEIETSSFPLPWTRNHFLHEIASPLSFPLVADDPAGGVVGYVCAVVVVDAGEILDVAVSPWARGRGIGENLVRQALREAGCRGAEVVHLEVRVTNAAAVTLYEKIGFRKSGMRRRYYENGDDALLMEFVFAGEG